MNLVKDYVLKQDKCLPKEIGKVNYENYIYLDKKFVYKKNPNLIRNPVLTIEDCNNWLDKAYLYFVPYLI